MRPYKLFIILCTLLVINVSATVFELIYHVLIGNYAMISIDYQTDLNEQNPYLLQPRYGVLPVLVPWARVEININIFGSLKVQ